MSSTRQRLIQLLHEQDGEYISGQQLSEQLDISRTAVWKHMKELEKEGFEIEAKSRVGYRIVNQPDVINQSALQWGLQTKFLGKNIIHKASVPSTQPIAHDLARENKPHGTVIIAEEQTAAKGRMNRPWQSPKGTGIWLSMILRPEIMPHQAPQLTLLTATVLAEVIYEETNVSPQIKWPNDILIAGKKIAGILTEMQAEQDQIQYVVLGFGMNVNQEEQDIDPDLRDRATSIRIATEKKWDRTKMIQRILERFEQTYDLYLREGFSQIKKKWENFGFKVGQKISLTMQDEKVTATFIGISHDGALIIENANGEKVDLYSAEINWFENI